MVCPGRMKPSQRLIRLHSVIGYSFSQAILCGVSHANMPASSEFQFQVKEGPGTITWALLLGSSMPELQVALDQETAAEITRIALIKAIFAQDVAIEALRNSYPMWSRMSQSSYASFL